MSIPLSRHESASIIAHCADGAVTAGRFYAAVEALAARLQPGNALLNTCQDRYRFMVGFGAAALAGCATLMPSNFAPHTVSLLRQSFEDLRGLHDGHDVIAGLPSLNLAEAFATGPDRAQSPEIDGDHVAAIVFTSGSTGEPTAHAKRWGWLARNGVSEAQRLHASGLAIVATVPPQHMYGFESSVLLALQGGASLWHGKPFYPADIHHALNAVPRPRMLVTTPFHLAKALDAGLAFPPCDQLLCATASLPVELARRAEAAYGAPLFEIYGCTESGQVASRRPTDDAAWELLPGVRMTMQEGIATVREGHVETPVDLSDVIEPAGAGRFHLIGRHADMVNIAGKRTSLAHLNALLTNIPGVEDGCFVQDDGAGQPTADVQRLGALAVAPGMDHATLLAALRERMDPVFLPRPLVLVSALPRNSTSKLVRAEVLALWRAERERGLQRHRPA